MKSYLIRVGGLVVVLAGSLRALAAVLPVSTPHIMTLYLVIDVLLLVSSIVLFEFQHRGIAVLGTLAVLLQALGSLILIARDLTIFGALAYPVGGLIFTVGLDLFVITSWRSKTLARWILILLVLSTVIGPIGFFSPGLAGLFTASGILFGIGFASAGISISLHPTID